MNKNNHEDQAANETSLGLSSGKSINQGYKKIFQTLSIQRNTIKSIIKKGKNMAC